MKKMKNAIGAEKVRRPNWDYLPKTEAQKMLREVNEKIFLLENKFNELSFRDYDEISKRLFEEKRRLLNILKN